VYLGSSQCGSWDGNCVRSEMMSRKYEFTGKTKVVGSTILRQIVRLSDGEVGGWIESEDNLSHNGDCLIGDQAMVYGNARVWGKAQIYGEAQVYGNAKISGKVQVSGEAHVWGDIRVRDYDVVVFGESGYLFTVADQHIISHGEFRLWRSGVFSWWSSPGSQRLLKEELGSNVDPQILIELLQQVNYYLHTRIKK